MERMAPYAIYFAAISQLIFLPLVALVVAGIVLAVFNGALGATPPSEQVFAVVMLFERRDRDCRRCSRRRSTTPANRCRARRTWRRSSRSSTTTRFGARLLGSIDLFLIWWMVSLAIGLAVLYKRRTAPIATTLLVVYVAIALIDRGDQVRACQERR